MPDPRGRLSMEDIDAMLASRQGAQPAALPADRAAAILRATGQEPQPPVEPPQPAPPQPTPEEQLASQKQDLQQRKQMSAEDRHAMAEERMRIQSGLQVQDAHERAAEAAKQADMKRAAAQAEEDMINEEGKRLYGKNWSKISGYALASDKLRKQLLKDALKRHQVKPTLAESTQAGEAGSRRPLDAAAAAKPEPRYRPKIGPAPPDTSPQRVDLSKYQRPERQLVSKPAAFVAGLAGAPELGRQYGESPAYAAGQEASQAVTDLPLMTGGAALGGMAAGPGGAALGSTLGPTLTAAGRAPKGQEAEAAKAAFEQGVMYAPGAILAPEAVGALAGPTAGALTGSAAALAPAALEGRRPTAQELTFAALPLAHATAGNIAEARGLQHPERLAKLEADVARRKQTLSDLRAELEPERRSVERRKADVAQDMLTEERRKYLDRRQAQAGERTKATVGVAPLPPDEAAQVIRTEVGTKPLSEALKRGSTTRTVMEMRTGLEGEALDKAAQDAMTPEPVAASSGPNLGVAISSMKRLAKQSPDPVDLGLSTWIQDPQHTLSRAAPEAQAAGSDLLLTSVKLQRKTTQETQERLLPIYQLPRGQRALARNTLVDILDGATEADINARQDLQPGVKQAALALRKGFDADRAEMVDTYKRWGFTVPPDWGLEGYLPHIFPGEYLIKGRNGEVIGSAKSKLEALSIIRTDAKAHSRPADFYSVARKGWNPGDVVRVSRPRQWKIINDLADAAGVSQSDIHDALRGIIGAKESKTKFFANTLKRHGAKGYSEDIEFILQHYIRSKNRFIMLSDLNRRIQPLVQSLRRQGLKLTADEVEANLAQLWGTPSKMSQEFDATVSKLPGVGLIYRNGGLDRWARRLRGGMAFALLTNAKWWTLNNLQTLQTLLPIVSNREFARGLKLYVTPEGRQILQRHGVKYFASRFSEGVPLTERIKSPGLRKIARLGRELTGSELRNQEIAFLTMYDKGRKMGMSDEEAADYAILRGNIYTQFLPSEADMPKILRNPLGKTIFQFKRFQIKNIGIGLDVVRDRNYPAAAKWTAMQLLLGGSKVALKYGPVIGAGAYALSKLPTATPEHKRNLERLAAAPEYITLSQYDQLKRTYGEQVAGVVMYGLPGLLGVDLSGSINVLDTPRGDTLAEQIGNTVMGAPGQLAQSAVKAYATTTGPAETSPLERVGKDAASKLPIVRMLDGIRRIYQKDYDWNTPDGKRRFTADWQEALKQAGNFRSSDRSYDSAFIDAQFEVAKRRNKVLNLEAQRRIADSPEVGNAAERWNMLFPEFPITGDDVMARAKGRARGDEKQESERLTPRWFRRGYGE